MNRTPLLRLCVSFGLAAGTAVLSAQQLLPSTPPKGFGASVTPAYEGWYDNADGTHTFLIGYYKLSGLLAAVALALNMIIVLAAIAALGAALSLPGIAGLVLSVAMAVDANVLIFERIREELRKNKTVASAIEAGYKNAFSAILDSNLTTMFAGVVLLYFGSGPVRGFAVTLCIGITASMFTALFVTRFVYDFITRRRKLNTLSV